MDVLLRYQIALHDDTIKLHQNYVALLRDMQKKTDISDIPGDIKAGCSGENNLDLSDVGGIMEGGQDIIWNRIRDAHPEEYKVEPNINNIEDTVLPDLNSNDTPRFSPDTDPDLSIKTPCNTINKLSKYKTSDQDKIIYEMYIKAKNNIVRLAVIDPSMNDNLDELVQEEADRLLSIYMSK